MEDCRNTQTENRELMCGKDSSKSKTREVKICDIAFKLIKTQDPCFYEVEQIQDKVPAVIQHIKIIATNFAFNWSRQTMPYTSFSIGNGLIILGKHIKTQKDFESALKGLVYCSYKTFLQPISHKGKQYYNDTLWGCTIRSTQMLYSQILSRICQSKSRKEILNMFHDKPDSSLGIHKACEVAMKKYSREPGEYWFIKTSILVFKDLMMNIPGFQHSLKVFKFENHEFNSGEILNSNMEESSFLLNDKIEDCLDESKVLSFMLTLGSSTIEQANFECLKIAFAMDSFVGMIGGVDTQAYYIYGICGEDLLFLDPHLTQVDNTPNVEIILSPKPRAV